MIVDVALLKSQLNWTSDMGAADDLLLDAKISAAQGHVESLIGHQLNEINYPSVEGLAYPATVPAPLKEAVLQLAAWWFVQRETAIAGVSVQSIPHGVDQIIQEHRDWTF